MGSVTWLASPLRHDACTVAFDLDVVAVLQIDHPLGVKHRERHAAAAEASALR